MTERPLGGVAACWMPLPLPIPPDMNGSLPLPPVLSEKLSDFRRRVWGVKLTEGLLAAVVGVGVSYLAVLVLDRVMETPAWLRGTLLVLGTAVPGFGLPMMWHRWVSRGWIPHARATHARMRHQAAAAAVPRAARLLREHRDPWDARRRSPERCRP